MKKSYERASMTVLAFGEKDIITTSDGWSGSRAAIVMPEDVFG